MACLFGQPRALWQVRRVLDGAQSVKLCPCLKVDRAGDGNHLSNVRAAGLQGQERVVVQGASLLGQIR